MSEILSLATIVGPIVLLAVIIWLTLRNRASSKREVARSEQGARDLRKDIERDQQP